MTAPRPSVPELVERPCGLRGAPRRFPALVAIPSSRRPAVPAVPPTLVVVAFLVGSPTVVLAGMPTWWFVGRAEHRRRVRREAERLEVEMVAVVDGLIQRLRSGATLSAGFVEVVADRPLARAELVDVLAAVASGRRLPDALDELARRPASPEPLRLLGTALTVLVSSGGPVGPALERLSETLRANRAARAEAVAQASQAFASAAMLATLPIVFALLVAVIEPAVRRFYLFTSSGAVCLAAAVGLVMAGGRWTERTVWGPSGPSCRRGRWAAESDSAALAAVIDLAAVVLGSGGTTGEALRVVGARGPSAVRDPVAELLERWRAGVGLGSVLADLPEVLGEEYRPFAAALLSTERDGAPVSSLLARLGDEARTARRHNAEIRARRMSVQLLLPLVCCSLPAVLIGAVMPLVIVSIGRL